MPMINSELEALACAGTPLISDALGRLDAIRGLTRFDGWRGSLVGPAFTVKTREGDNLALLHALGVANPGDVLVVDGGGALHRALAGDLARRFAMTRGITGFVIEGAIRDVSAFQTEEPFGCFARGTSHNGPFKDGPGRINVPVAIGGQVVNPGDIIVADNEGIVSFAPHRLSWLVKAAADRTAAEATIRGQISSGEQSQPWLEALMAEAGSKLS
ncbi:MAG: RraA family protein [Novosphingobium sp.]